MNMKVTIPVLMATALFAAGCGGGRGAFEDRPTTETVVPNAPPGSGQLGPGYVSEDERRMYGAGDSTGEVNTDGVSGNAGRGEHQEHNRLPGTGNRP
jgi:hypothetical protein